ncbi:transmembrane protein 245 isoform X2 [Cephus cinctus]|uniref:Transmembrane protein 245 isoform X2 n=1 Tax=Cephus cinctus TaxID=211228 RepID=A0AAJ7FDX5_CEPCN|nr:transmembrane protein 245 isoform X2 [Cephus cinctus]
MDIPRTPMDNLLNMLSGFSPDHEKAFKQGFYNAVAIFLLCLGLSAGYGLYIILSPFVKPLIWALLCGSVLFPFKLSITSIVQSWFTAAEMSNKPLIVNLTMIPIRIVDELSDVIGSFLVKHLKYIAVILVVAGTVLIAYNYTPNILTCLAWRIFKVVNAVLNFFISTCNVFTLVAVVAGYLSLLYIYWTLENSARFRYSSFVVWFIVSLYISNILGAYQVVVFLTLQLLYLIGFVYEVILILEHQELDGHQTSFMEAARYALTNNIVTTNEVDASVTQEDDAFVEEKSIGSPKNLLLSGQHPTTSKEKSENNTTLKFNKESISSNADVRKSSMGSDSRESQLLENMRPIVKARERYFIRKLRTEFRMSLDIEDDKVDTDKYMYGATYACVGMLLWKHRWIIHMLSIPIIYYIVKQIGCYFGFWKTIRTQCQSLVDVIRLWCKERHQALIPVNVRGLYKVCMIVDRKITIGLKGSVDAVATITVILGLLVFVTCASIFITIQVYAEGMHLVQVTGDVLNASLVNNPDIDWVPEQWEDSVNSVLDNAYTYGRSAISDGIRGLVKDLEPTKAEQMEKKVLELWDRLYQAWMMSNDSPDMVGPTVDADAAYSVWESFKENFDKTPVQLFNMTSIQNFAKENVGILMSLLDSVWSIVKGNISVILSIITELLYVVLMSGSAVLNFSLSMVVFFTTLFYLLNASGKTYKPIELITMFSPVGCYRFAMALQEAVIGVFAATFKLASFFGMWTWFTHNLFQVKIVYLPSAFAMMLGAVPFLDAYFACIPAALELWFTRGPMIAVLFFMFHFLPCNIVVTEFYKGIKGGGHPYLTALSIGGGIFCLGVEGAILGPLLLCCIMVVINLSRRYLQSPSEDTIKSLKNQLSELKRNKVLAS